MSRLEFHVGKKSDGFVFAMPLRTERAIKDRFAEAKTAERIFIGYGTASDYQTIHGDLYEQMATLLSGLSKQQLLDLGGWRFIEPTTDQLLFEGPREDRAA